MGDGDRLLQKSSRQSSGHFVHGASQLAMRRHPMFGTRPVRPSSGAVSVSAPTKDPIGRDQSIPVIVHLASTYRLAAVVRWTGKANGR